MSNSLFFSDNLKIKVLHILEPVTDIDSLAEAKNRTDSDSRKNTILYNDFKTSVDAYYFGDTILQKDGVNFSASLYSRTPSSVKEADHFIMKQQNIDKAMIDYNIHNKDYYTYSLSLLIENNGTFTTQRVLLTDDKSHEKWILTRWNSWSICDIVPTEDETLYKKQGNVWLLGLNAQEEKLTQNLSLTSWNTLGRFPQISKGVQNYISGTVTCLLGQMEEIDNTYDYTECQNINENYTTSLCNPDYADKKFETTQYGREMEKYNAWLEFCNDGELKLLKDIKGNAWVIQITQSPENSYNSGAYKMPTTVTFNWSEVLDINKISIMG